MKRLTLILSAGLLLAASAALAGYPEPQRMTVPKADIEAARLAATHHPLGEVMDFEDVEKMASEALLVDGLGDRANDDNDTAHYARGSTLIINVFINHSGGTWTASEMTAAGAKSEVAKQYYLDNAPPGANLSFDDALWNYVVTLPYDIPYSGVDGDVVHDAVYALGFTDADGDGIPTDDFTMYLQGWNGGWDNVIAVYQADVTGRAWASYGTASTILYTDSNANVWAHEWGHSFGACDEYVEGGQCNGGIDCGLCQSWYLDYDVDNGNCQLASCPSDVSCLMINNTFSNVCDYTLKHWAWEDSDSNGQLDIVERRVSGDTFTNIWELWHDGYFSWNSVDQGMVAHQKWNSWAVFGLRSPVTADYDPYLFADNNHNTELANSYTGYDVDFIVGDYNHNRLGNEHLEVRRYSGDTANYNLTFESGTSMLYADGISRDVSWASYNVVRAWDVPLLAGETLTFRAHSLSTGMDVGLALFKSSGGTYFAGRTSAVAASYGGGVGADEEFTYTVPEDDVYGLVAWTEVALNGDFEIQIGPSPYTLAEESPYYSAYDLRLFNYDPNAYYWSVIGTRPDADTDVDCALYADENYTELLETSAGYGTATTEFVAVDYYLGPFSRDHWRVVKSAGTGNHRSEWEHDSDILRGYVDELWDQNHVAKIWDFHCTAGQDYLFREYHADTDFDTGIYLFSSAGDDFYRSRNQYAGASNFRPPEAGGEWFRYTASDTRWNGFVTISNDDNNGHYGIMAGPDIPLTEDVAVSLGDEIVFASNTISWAWWTVFGVRPSDGASASVWLYGDDAYTIDTLAASDQEYDNSVNFVVGDYNHIGSSQTVYPRFYRSEGGGDIDMEFEGGGEAMPFTPGSAEIYDLTWPAGDVVEIWDVWLNDGESALIQVADLSGVMDLGVAVFASNGDAYYASEELAAVRANDNGVGGTEAVAFTADHDDWYGLVVWNENDAGGDYRVTLQDMSTVPVGDLPLPAEFALSAASANPFAGSVSLRYSLPVGGPVTLDVYDVRGRRVRTLLTGAAEAGRHVMAWDGRSDAGDDLPGGIYLARLKAGGRTCSAKLVRVH